MFETASECLKVSSFFAVFSSFFFSEPLLFCGTKYISPTFGGYACPLKSDGHSDVGLVIKVAAEVVAWCSFFT